MIRPLLRQLRSIRRMFVFFWAAFYGLWRHRNLPPGASRADGAQWLHESCSRCVRALGVELSVQGSLPTHGLIVSNHLSYIDIGVLSAAVPCVFVSKAEVEDWPIFGRYARWAGSVFVRRHDRADAARANVSLGASLGNGVPVVLFPEGTTTDGERVLRFHSTMLQPAIDTAAAITPSAIRYELDEGDPAREVCWWGDMRLLSHMWNLAGKKSIQAKIIFGEPVIPRDPEYHKDSGVRAEATVGALSDRKDLSRLLHDRVVRLYGRLIDGRGEGGPTAVKPMGK